MPTKSEMGRTDKLEKFLIAGVTPFRWQPNGRVERVKGKWRGAEDERAMDAQWSKDARLPTEIGEKILEMAAQMALGRGKWQEAQKWMVMNSATVKKWDRVWTGESRKEKITKKVTRIRKLCALMGRLLYMMEVNVMSEDGPIRTVLRDSWGFNSVRGEARMPLMTFAPPVVGRAAPENVRRGSPISIATEHVWLEGVENLKVAWTGYASKDMIILDCEKDDESEPGVTRVREMMGPVLLVNMLPVSRGAWGWEDMWKLARTEWDAFADVMERMAGVTVFMESEERKGGTLDHPRKTLFARLGTRR